MFEVGEGCGYWTGRHAKLAIVHHGGWTKETGAVSMVIGDVTSGFNHHNAQYMALGVSAALWSGGWVDCEYRV